MNKNAAIASIILLLSVCFSASCETDNVSRADGAERQLERTLSAVKGKKLLYKSSSEVKMDGTTVHNVSGSGAGYRDGDSVWDPVESLRLLDRVQKTVEFEAGEADGELRFILVKVDPEDWKQIVEDRTRRQLDEKKAEENALVSSNRSRLPLEQMALMEKELQDSVSRVEERLNRMFATLTAKGMYRISIDRSTGLPRKMILENAMRYEDGGKPQEETVVFTYIFQ